MDNGRRLHEYNGKDARQHLKSVIFYELQLFLYCILRWINHRFCFYCILLYLLYYLLYRTVSSCLSLIYVRHGQLP